MPLQLQAAYIHLQLTTKVKPSLLQGALILYICNTQPRRQPPRNKYLNYAHSKVTQKEPSMPDLQTEIRQCNSSKICLVKDMHCHLCTYSRERKSKCCQSLIFFTREIKNRYACLCCLSLSILLYLPNQDFLVQTQGSE